MPESPERPVATAARVYDYMLGGTHNSAVDREAAAHMVRSFPLAAVGARYNREFLGRVVRFLTGAGVRQFLDLGSGIPTVGNVHEIAQAEAPGARVVYVDYERDAVELGQRILSDNPDATALLADLREPDVVLGSPEVTGLLDFSRPVAVLMISVLHFVPDDAQALDLVRRYLSRLTSGSYFALSHLVRAEGRAGNLQRETRHVYNSTVAENLAIREPGQIAAFFAGLELVEPGLVAVPDWRPDDPDYVPDEEDVPRRVGLAGVGRVP
ncbi:MULTISPECIES: SAM-dependent methyltransferase [Amycolatopsis]|uniref:O-Methyltransferase involved in polyketide biosynthesis n=2 Tax=Amycolatopsis TaxID=1813 RepID=A0A1I4BZJ1_9PSEU|nr:SAM-dependent methyltransferase [Amycolatopsis sacchari]SFK74224.1 O-Methyltransferase involved in polyketide biosynthesis [Amycolatopsis sacchari]